MGEEVLHVRADILGEALRPCAKAPRRNATVELAFDPSAQRLAVEEAKHGHFTIDVDATGKGDLRIQVDGPRLYALASRFPTDAVLDLTVEDAALVIRHARSTTRIPGQAQEQRAQPHASAGKQRLVRAEQAAVAHAGAAVMPFDLNRTRHRFDKRPDGGVQAVVSTDDDTRQTALVRQHLRVEAGRFSEGEFASPAEIHGAEMPGLATLKAHASGIGVTYRDVPGGGEIRFASADPLLVLALHAWFDAQLADHGAHATGHEHK